MALSKEQIEGALKDVMDPGSGTDLVASHAVKDVAVDGDAVQGRDPVGLPGQGNPGRTGADRRGAPGGAGWRHPVRGQGGLGDSVATRCRRISSR